jgi:hypothetical protein
LKKKPQIIKSKQNENSQNNYRIIFINWINLVP